ncbi:MAG TPA: hypothetical protein VEV38_07925, partial [Candidatus Eremiobacteraceae bacterium]|nr:hypothetical protein [Candidatus Eremiobacteraceae bacterium]
MSLTFALVLGFLLAVGSALVRDKLSSASSGIKSPRKAILDAVLGYVGRLGIWSLIVYVPLALVTSFGLFGDNQIGWLQQAAISFRSDVERASGAISELSAAFLLAAGCFAFASSRFGPDPVIKNGRFKILRAILSRSAFDTVKHTSAALSAASMAFLLLTFIDLPNDAIVDTTISPKPVPENAIRVNLIDHEIARTMAVQLIRELSSPNSERYPFLDAVYDWELNYARLDTNGPALSNRFMDLIQRVAKARPLLADAMRTRWKTYCSGYSAPLGNDVYTDEAIDRSADFLFSLSTVPSGELPKLFRNVFSEATAALFKLERDDFEATSKDIAAAKSPNDLDRRLRADAAATSQFG